MQIVLVAVGAAITKETVSSIWIYVGFSSACVFKSRTTKTLKKCDSDSFQN